MMYRCIAIDEKGVQCDSTSETPTNATHPEWGYLCSPCANQPARSGSRNTHGIVLERPVKIKS